MALVANYGTDSESGEEDEILKDTNGKNLLTTTDSDSDSEHESRPNSADKLSERLPLPMFMMNQSETNEMKKLPSVFRNPFEDEENEKFSILEKHVKMTHSDTNMKNDRKNICHRFRKGRCRFGDKCRFAHSAKTDKIESLISQNVNTFAERVEQEIPNEEHENVKKQKRKAGLSRNLIPSKKAMKSYERTQAEERPWTLNN